MSTDTQIEEFRKKEEARNKHADEMKRQSAMHTLQSKIDILKKHLTELEGKIKNAELHLNGKHQIITKTEKDANYVQEHEVEPKKALIEKHQSEIEKLQRSIELSLQKMKHDQGIIAQKQHELVADEKTIEELNTHKNATLAEIQELEEDMSKL